MQWTEYGTRTIIQQVRNINEIIDLRGDFKSKTIVFQKGTLDG